MFGKLKGKKTYVTAFIAIVTAFGAYMVGDASLADTAQIILTAVLGATVRNGMN